MGFVMPHVLILAAMGVVALALLLQIIGLATAEWIVTEIPIFGTKSSSSLWRACGPGGCSSSVLAYRAFGILGVLALVASLLCGVLIGLMSEQKIFTLLAPITSAVGAFCIMIEFAVFAGNTTLGTYSSYGYSFGLTIAAFVLALAATALYFIGRMSSRASA